MKKNLLMVSACFLAVLIASCAQLEEKNRVKAAEVSPFLPHQELLVKQAPSFPFHYFYLKKDAGMYENIYVAPVNTQYLRDNQNWAKLDQKLAQSIGSDIDKLAEYTRSAFCDAFATAPGPQKLNVVNAPTKGRTLSVEVAIVTIVPTKAELNILGTAGNLLLPGIGIITGHLAGGSVTIECLIRDTKTGEIIAMFANTERDQRAILNFAGMTWYNSAKKNIQKQAETTANVFSGSDYSYTRRKLIKLIEI